VTKVAGKRRCLHRSWTNTDDANMMATALRCYLKSCKNDDMQPRSFFDVATEFQVSKSALNHHHKLYEKFSASSDSETFMKINQEGFMKMDQDGIVQHASSVRCCPTNEP
jgi:hypothetical protein